MPDPNFSKPILIKNNYPSLDPPYGYTYIYPAGGELYSKSYGGAQDLVLKGSGYVLLAKTVQIPALAGFPAFVSGATVNTTADENCGMDFDSIQPSIAFYKTQVPLKISSNANFNPKLRVRASFTAQPEQHIVFQIEAKRDDASVYDTPVLMTSLITGGYDYVTLDTNGYIVGSSDSMPGDWINIKITRRTDLEISSADSKVTLTEISLTFD